MSPLATLDKEQNRRHVAAHRARRGEAQQNMRLFLIQLTDELADSNITMRIQPNPGVIDFIWDGPQEAFDAIQAWCMERGHDFNDVQDALEQSILGRMVKAKPKRERHAQEAQEHRAAELAEVKADLARLRALTAADQEAMKEAVRTGQPVKFEKV